MRNLFLLIALCCVAFSVRAQRLVEVGKGFSSTSVNTTVFRNGIKEQIDTITNRYNKWLYLFHM